MQQIIALLLLLLSFSSFAIDEPELLEPEQAFRFSARMVAPDRAEVQYQIADGYYLYHHKFKFSSPDAKLGNPVIPPGKVKQDEFFGQVETHRGSLTISLPVTLPAGASQFTLKASSQGCADRGVCYPPTDNQIVLKTASQPPATSSGGLGSLLQPLLGKTAPQEEFLPPEQAFKVTVSSDDRNLTARFSIAPDYYLYRDKIRFVAGDSSIKLGTPALPPAEQKQDPNFGPMAVYKHDFSVTVPLPEAKPADGKLAVTVHYQGCSEKGVCYPPQTSQFNLNLSSDGTGSEPATPAQAASTGDTAANSASAAAPANEQDRVASLFAGGNWWLIVAFFFGAGLLLALTPCVFPMIPILSGIIAGEGQNISKKRGFILSFAYVQGMAITYAIAGIIAGKSGTLLSAALQNPWVLGAFAAVFVLLALSMFGFYELQMPSAIQSRFTDASNRMKGGRLAGVFTMGMLSAVIVGPCVAAPLAGALLYIGQTGNVWLGGSALYSMALGMGVPLILVGLSAGALLPRAGGWMDSVKAFFGVLLLGVAIWLISPVISSLAHMLLWAVLLIISSMYLKAIDPLPVNAHGFQRFWKGVGIIALVSGVALLLGALSGHRDILQPLQGQAQAAGSSQQHALNFRQINSPAELDQALQENAGRTVMLDFYADWCVSCKELERFTFSDPQVQARLANTVLLQADVTANSAEHKALLKRFGLFGPPGIIFFDGNGQEIPAARIIGYLPPERFLQQIDPHLQ